MLGADPTALKSTQRTAMSNARYPGAPNSRQLGRLRNVIRSPSRTLTAIEASHRGVPLHERTITGSAATMSVPTAATAVGRTTVEKPCGPGTPAISEPPAPTSAALDTAPLSRNSAADRRTVQATGAPVR